MWFGRIPARWPSTGENALIPRMKSDATRKCRPFLRLTVLLGIAAGLPLSAAAEHDLVFISSVVKVDDSDCAIELTISGNDQDAFVNADSIQVDGDVLVTMENLIEAGINESASENDKGDHILAGSVSFEDEHDIAADLVFSDSECATLDNANIVGYYIDEDSDGETDQEIDTVEISDFSDFDADSALTKTSRTATPELKDLTETSVTLTNNAGEEVKIEAASSSTSTGGLRTTCSLHPAAVTAKASTKGMLALLVLTGAIISWWRMRKGQLIRTPASRADTVHRG